MEFLNVSIITVCYNSAKTIEQTIQSVINQSYNNIEYIIIDGGSTDGTVDIIKKYNDKIAYWVSETDDGIYDAMNKGIALATGEIVGIINSDDWYSMYAVEKAIEYFLDGDCDIVYGDLTFISTNGKQIAKSAKNVRMIDICYKNIHWHPTVFVKLSMYKKYGNFDCRYKIYADYQFLLQLFYNKAVFRYIPFNMAYFRMNGFHNKYMWRLIKEEKNIAMEGLKNMDMSRQEDTKIIIERHYQKNRKNIIGNFCIKKISKYDIDHENIKKILKNSFNCLGVCQIFGTGIDGKECYRLLSDNNITITCFFDNHIHETENSYINIPIVEPPHLKQFGGNLKIIIATSKYEKEIIKQLELSGFIHNQDFICFSELKDEIISLYIKKITNKKKRSLVEYEHSTNI